MKMEGQNKDRDEDIALSRHRPREVEAKRYTLLPLHPAPDRRQNITLENPNLIPLGPRKIRRAPGCSSVEKVSSLSPIPSVRTASRATTENPNFIPLGRCRIPKTPESSLEEKISQSPLEERAPPVSPVYSTRSTLSSTTIIMAPTQTDQDLIGPHPSFIEVAKPYIFQQRIQDCLFAIGMTEAKDDNVRLQGVAWIDNVRKSMQLPVRTFNTAVVYYHKFRLVHSDNQYNWADAAAAALFTACKIEDTLKKSREILCASYNLKLSPAEHLTPDDPLFESHSKTIIGLERLMLESSGFDFRSRHPQELVIKLAKACSFTKDLEGKTAYKISLDLYRTFAPVKQTTSTMAIACVELAARLHEIDLARVLGEDGINYARFSTSRAEVMETLLDLLDLYTHHKPSTVVGPDYPLEYYISIRITLNQEASASSLPRYTSKLAPPLTQTNGTKGKNGTTTLASPPAPIIAPISATGTRGQSGTVRFMLDAARASAEKEAVKEYFTVEEEEYEVDVEVDPGKTRRPR